MSDETTSIEDLLRQAFRPVEPPEHLPRRFEDTVLNLASFAADQLEGLEPDALRDPHNWGRQATAVVAGGAAAAALVAYEVHRRGSRTQAKRSELHGLVNRVRERKSTGDRSIASRAAEVGSNAGGVLRDLAEDVRHFRRD